MISATRELAGLPLIRLRWQDAAPSAPASAIAGGECQRFSAARPGMTLKMFADDTHAGNIALARRAPASGDSTSPLRARRARKTARQRRCRAAPLPMRRASAPPALLHEIIPPSGCRYALPADFAAAQEVRRISRADEPRWQAAALRLSFRPAARPPLLGLVDAICGRPAAHFSRHDGRHALYGATRLSRNTTSDAEMPPALFSPAFLVTRDENLSASIQRGRYTKPTLLAFKISAAIDVPSALRALTLLLSHRQSISRSLVER